MGEQIGYNKSKKYNKAKRRKLNKFSKGKLAALYLVIFISTFLLCRYIILNQQYFDDTNKSDMQNELPTDYKYKNINIDNLKRYLDSKNSMLAEEPYMLSIINAAKRYDVNPLLLFAITGQEQNFVPKTDYQAKKIANNPFNVYGSWIKYNTNIEDSASIAAGTVVALTRKRPSSDNNVIKWINLKYSEDSNWYKGVTAFLNQLEQSQ